MAGLPFGAHDEDQATDYMPAACPKSGGQIQFLASFSVPQKRFLAHVFPNLVLETPLGHFFRYTFSPTFSSRFGIVTLPSVEAMMIVFPEAEGPNSLDRSTLIVNRVPSTVISTFFMIVAFQ